MTNDLKLAKKAKHLTSTAKIPHKWEYTHDEVGYNYRMSNINAALGCAQLEQISKYLMQKLYKQYLDAFLQFLKFSFQRTSVKEIIGYKQLF